MEPFLQARILPEGCQAFSPCTVQTCQSPDLVSQRLQGSASDRKC